MDSVPVWVLTAVLEISLLCTGALGLIAILLWQGQQRLRRQIRQVYATLGQQAAVGVPLPAAHPEALATTPPDDAPLPVDDHDTPHVNAEEMTPASEESDAMLPPVPTLAQEAEFSGVLTQDLLVSLLASAPEEECTADPPEQEAAVSEAAQSVAAMLAEHVTMEQQIYHMQEKNSQLRLAIEELLTNVDLPPEEQQELKVPEQTMQEIERGLTALQETRQRMLQQLHAHCQVLGIDDPDTRGVGAAGDAGSEARTATMRLQEEVHHLQTALEQQATDFQRVQEEYEQLLVEYQRVFENSATRQ